MYHITHMLRQLCVFAHTHNTNNKTMLCSSSSGQKLLRVTLWSVGEIVRVIIKLKPSKGFILSYISLKLKQHLWCHLPSTSLYETCLTTLQHAVHCHMMPPPPRFTFNVVIKSALTLDVEMLSVSLWFC